MQLSWFIFINFLFQRYLRYLIKLFVSFEYFILKVHTGKLNENVNEVFSKCFQLHHQVAANTNS